MNCLTLLCACGAVQVRYWEEEGVNMTPSNFLQRMLQSFLILACARILLALIHVCGWNAERQLGKLVADTKSFVRRVVRYIYHKKPPHVADAPGLTWKERQFGWLAMWKAPKEAVKLGYRPRTMKLIYVGDNPTQYERDYISEMCVRQQYDLVQHKHALTAARSNS
jgi:hypothetical protein